MAREHIVGKPQAGQRLDHFLRPHLPGLSRAAVLELLGQGAIRVNGRPAKKGQLLREADVVELPEPADTLGPAPDSTLALSVLHEDPWLVVVNKPAGVPSHALRPGETGTVTSMLLHRYPEMAMAGVGHRLLEPGILHRLDTDTSGVLLAARDATTFAALRELSEQGAIEKRYLALCAGRVPAPQLLAAYLRADQKRVRVEPAPFDRAKPIETEILSSETLGDFSLVEVRVRFAARHQIRAQLAALGHPIAADTLYGGPDLTGLHRHFLHASALCLRHPHTGEALRIRASLPADLDEVLTRLRG